MSKRISIYIASWMINNNVIKNEERALYEYCYSYLIENALYAVIILFISIFIDCFDIGVVLVSFQFVLRVTGGGAHASTRSVCTIVSYGQDVLILILVPMLVNIPSTCWIVSFILGYVIIFTTVPVDCPNKRLDDKQKKEYRRRCLLCLSVITVLFITFIHYNLWRLYITTAFCVIIDAVGLMIGIMNNRKAEKC